MRSKKSARLQYGTLIFLENRMDFESPGISVDVT
jgi:hypothetical protein